MGAITRPFKSSIAEDLALLTSGIGANPEAPKMFPPFLCFVLEVGGSGDSKRLALETSPL
jgi:hypothetical protein